jgi:hypothetical protein
MRIVWLVEQLGEPVAGVFSTKALAEAFVAAHPDVHLILDPYELDGTSGPLDDEVADRET